MKTLNDYLGLLLADMYRNGRHGTAGNYLNVCRNYVAFSGKSNLTLKDAFSKKMLDAYQEYLGGKGCCMNSIGAYNRILRAVYNRVVKARLLPLDDTLFDDLFLGSEPTDKRALLKDEIIRLFTLNLSNPSLKTLRMSWDLLMLMFLLQGISFVDLAHLKKTDVRNGLIFYRRQKTGTQIVVKILDKAQEILDRYRDHDASSPYLLPIINHRHKDPETSYRSALRKFNRHLKKLAVLANISSNLTSYVLRHSWATLAYHIGVPTSKISDAMGHRTEEVTRIYLASHDAESIGYANQMVWESLFGETEKGKGKTGKEKGNNGAGNVSFLAGVRHNSTAKESISSEIHNSL